MSEMSFEQMLEESFKTIRNGEVVEGVVIGVKPDEIILNIGYKSDGIITRNEYTNEANVDLTTVVSVGDTMEAKVLKVNDGEGQVLLTYKRLAAEKGSKRLEEAFNNQEVLTAKVTQVLSGGLSVVVDEARVFIPASLVSDTYEKDLSKYEGQEISFVITEFNPRKRRIIGDRKQLLVAEKAEKQKELMERIHVGDVVEGTVKNVTDFGAFIDLGGADGLLHISEMSWGRVENPKKVFKVGDTVKVFIKDIKDTKIALSVKFPEENPWNNAAEKYAVGTVVTGKVARMTDFGAFVELAPGEFVEDVQRAPGGVVGHAVERPRVRVPAPVHARGNFSERVDLCLRDGLQPDVVENLRTVAHGLAEIFVAVRGGLRFLQKFRVIEKSLAQPVPWCGKICTVVYDLSRLRFPRIPVCPVARRGRRVERQERHGELAAAQRGLLDVTDLRLTGKLVGLLKPVDADVSKRQLDGFELFRLV